ncbi:MAG: iron-sulfur cluster assembly accessory protein [Acidobacteriota bacterium]|nr:MAG: iron-sulfur cluster assembly accessory protein [Acidobacteriota bacterium]
MAIIVTESAANRIKQGLANEGFSEGGLRLGVKGGGCSGLNYVIRFEKAKRAGDKIFEKDGAHVYVDLKSLLYLKGTTLDWSGDLMQQGFTFSNPNAKKTCSCGISFTV